MNLLEEKSRVLIFEGQRLEPISTERNMVGFCSRCDGDLHSLAYNSTETSNLVSACCQNGHMILMRYDRQWKWLGDSDLQVGPEKIAASTISKEMLEAVFTAAEIRDMLACERGEPYVRQNVYRARAKYERFEKLFGIKLNI